MRFPYFFVTLLSAWAITRWNVAVALHNPNGILFHWNNPSSHAKPVFSRSCFLSVSALCFEKTSAFRFSTALSESSSRSDIYPIRCAISRRTGLFAANSVSVGLSGKFEQLDNTSSVSDFIENNFLEDFNSFILSSIHSWFACKEHFVFQVLHTLKVCVQRQCVVAKFLSPLYCHCGCFCVQQHTLTQIALSEKLLPKISELLLLGLGTRHTCLSLLNSFRFLILNFATTAWFGFNLTFRSRNIGTLAWLIKILLTGFFSYFLSGSLMLINPSLRSIVTSKLRTKSLPRMN